MSTVTQQIRTAVRRSLPRGLVVQRLPARAPSRSVLLTFDDGPHPDVTPAVLDRLASHGARAVFFIVGKRIRRAPHLLAAIQQAGHVIGNHSLLHREGYIHAGGRRPTFAEYYRDCARCQAVLERRTGTRPTMFRPPGGRLTPTTILVPKLLGLSCVTWSQDVKDWAFRSPADAREGAATLLGRIGPGDIVLLHDDNRFVVDLLDLVLPELVARAYDLASAADTLST